MTFDQCIRDCAADQEFVRRFNMLTGHLFQAREAATPIDKLIDGMLGADTERASLETEDAVAFRKYVFDCVWSCIDVRAADKKRYSSLAR